MPFSSVSVSVLLLSVGNDPQPGKWALLRLADLGTVTYREWTLKFCFVSGRVSSRLQADHDNRKREFEFENYDFV